MTKPANGRTKPDWQEARRFVEAIAGAADPVMTFQVFDDKGEHYEWAAWRHGRLSDRELRKWLIAKSEKGCGVYVTVNECDGAGRRRQNVKKARAVWVDFDEASLPPSWPMQPNIITVSSSGRHQAFFLIEPTEDLNGASDCQARLAEFYGGDPKVIDPSRVCRLPGFDHLKREPYRSHLLYCENPADLKLGEFNRATLDAIVTAHPCEYTAPATRSDGGRSDAPAGGWNNDVDVERARAWLKNAPPSIEGDGGNHNAFNIACKCNDFGLSSEMTVELLSEEWNTRCEPPWSDEELQQIAQNAQRYKQNSPGVQSVANLDLEFENPPDAPTKESKGALNVQRASDIKVQNLEWLWLDRFPLGKLSLIAGFPDQGKSQITLSMAATVSTGGEWPNGEGKAEAGGVIILSSEDDAADTLVPRLMAAGADLEKILIIGPMVTEKVDGKTVNRVFNIDDDLKNLSKEIRKAEEDGNPIRMIVLDPINAYFGGQKKGDSHKNSDMRALLTPITEWAGNLRLAVVAISHFNKGGNAHTLYRITDSMAITATARAAWFTLKDEENDKMLLVSGKHNLSKAVPGLSYEINAKEIGIENIIAPFVVWTGTTEKTAEEVMGAMKAKNTGAIKEAQQFLLETLEGGPVPAKEVFEAAKAHGISGATLKRARLALGVDPLKITFEGGWSLALPNPADDFMDADPDRTDREDEFKGEGDEPDFG